MSELTENFMSVFTKVKRDEFFQSVVLKITQVDDLLSKASITKLFTLLQPMERNPNKSAELCFHHANRNNPTSLSINFDDVSGKAFFGDTDNRTSAKSSDEVINDMLTWMGEQLDEYLTDKEKNSLSPYIAPKLERSREPA